MESHPHKRAGMTNKVCERCVGEGKRETKRVEDKKKRRKKDR